MNRTFDPLSDVGYGRRSFLRKVLIVVAAGILSAFVGELYEQIAYGDSGNTYFLGARTGLTIGAIATAIEVFYIRSMRRSWIRRIAFLPGIIVRILVITIIIRICLVGNGMLTNYLLGEPIAIDNSIDEQIRDTLVSLAIVIVFVALGQLSSIIGLRRFVHLVVGRYFRPVQEERIFLFVDLIGSSAAAQDMGDVRFHEYLSEFFYQVDRAIVRWGGEVVSYVGDAVIVTWKLHDDPKRNADCLRTLQTIHALSEAQSDRFLQDFGRAPEFYAALHCGPVVVGECGDSRRQVTFLGDAVNMTARIEQACKGGSARMLLSDALVNKVEPLEGMTFRSYGEMMFKGASEPLKLHSVSFDGVANDPLDKAGEKLSQSAA